MMISRSRNGVGKVRLSRALVALGLVVLTACSSENGSTDSPDVAAAPTPGPAGSGNSDEEIVYGLGLMMAESLSVLALSPRERRIFEQALRDHREGTVRLPLSEVLDDISPFQQVRLARALELEEAAGEAFLIKARAEDGARELDSGAVVRSLEEGEGEPTGADGADAVVVSYVVRLRNGTVVDSSESMGGPQTFSFYGSMPCWQDVLPEMRIGDKVKLTCPPERAYGKMGQLPMIPGSATVETELELVRVLENGGKMHGGAFRKFTSGGPIH